ncbi:MAG TPA: putative Ig domain-containing protein, partial [Bryobacteraceae bacterium]
MRPAVGIVSSLFFAGASVFAQQYTITTVAGGTPIPTPATALNSPIGSPGAMTTDASGNVYFVANDSVFKIDLSGNLTRVAGNSRLGFSGDGAAATSAQLYNPGGLAVDSGGNIYIADSGNNRIRKVTPSNGNIGTIAGLATAGYTGDTNAATGAQLNNPQGLAIDSSGNLYIADAGNHAIRKITAATGVITTIAGTGFPGNSGDGQTATTAQLNGPQGVAVDTALNVYIADSNNHKIREVQNGIMSTIAGNGIAGYSGDNGLAKTAQLNLPTQVAVDPGGVIYITDSNNQRVRKIVTSGVITTVAGGGSGPVGIPSGIATDTGANLYVADSSGSHILKFTPSGSITIIAGTGTRYNLGDGGNATAAQLVTPEGLAVSAQGIYIADKGEARIRKIQPGGTITSPPGATGIGPAGVAVDSGENLFIADTAGNQVLKVAPGGQITLIAGTGIPGAFGDGGLATVAQLNQPSGVAVDASGNVYIADTVNNRIRKVTLATGIITTIAGSSQGFGGDNQIATSALLNQPAGITLDTNGNIYIADTGNNRIREITTTGIITTVAGNGTNAWGGDNGAATQASISSPHGVAVDGRFNIYIPDYSGRVRKVATSGIITTIAGSSTQGYSGDSGPALSGQLSTPWGITVDGSGYVYVSDPGAQAVRELSPATSTTLAVQSTSLANAAVGIPYAQTVLASGGTPPYTWTSSTLPPGLTLSSAGSITGTPTAAGTFFINFQVTDSGSFTAQATIGLVISGSGGTGLNITTSPLLIPGAVGVNYSQPLSATSGNPPYTWTLVSGALPAGVTLSPNGLISGVPTVSGTSTFTV